MMDNNKQWNEEERNRLLHAMLEICEKDAQGKTGMEYFVHMCRLRVALECVVEILFMYRYQREKFLKLLEEAAAGDEAQDETLSLSDSVDEQKECVL